MKMPASDQAHPYDRTDPRQSNQHAVGAYAVLLVCCALTAVLYIGKPALPYNPISLPFEESLNTLLWAPQGWGFFTRSPREERLTAYQFVDGRWRNPMRVPHALPRNVFGLNRVSRSQSVEMGLLLYAAKQEWKSCADPLMECLDHAPPPQAIRNPCGAPAICGAIVVVQRQPIPWAWLKAPKHVEMPTRLLSLDVRC
jgi:antimicrobial peptide system SdpA family protein